MESFQICIIFVAITMMATRTGASDAGAHMEATQAAHMMHDPLFTEEEKKMIRDAAMKVGADGEQLMHDVGSVMMHHMGEVNASDIIDSMHFAEKLRKGQATLQQVPETVKQYFKGAEEDMNQMLNYMKDPSSHPLSENIKSVIMTGKEKIMNLLHGSGGSEGSGSSSSSSGAQHQDNNTPKENAHKSGAGTMTASLLIVSVGIAIGFIFCR